MSFRRFLPLLVLLTLATASGMQPSMEPQTTEPPYRFDPHYLGPAGCEAPPVLPVLTWLEGVPRAHDADGDGRRDPGETVVLSAATTAQAGDLLLSGPDAGRRVSEGDALRGAPLVETGGWAFVDHDGNGAYSGSDAVLVHAGGDPSVGVGDLVLADPFSTEPRPEDVGPDHPLLGTALLPLDAAVGVRDLDGDGAWDDGDEVRLMHAGEARMGDVLVGGGVFGTVVRDMEHAELPLDVELPGWTLRQGPAPEGRLYLGGGDRVETSDLRLDRPSMRWFQVRGTDGDLHAPLREAPGRFAFVSDPLHPANGAVFWDLDADGTVSRGDLRLSDFVPPVAAGTPLVPLDVPVRALDRDWDGRLSPYDYVLLDVDGNSRWTLNDHRFLGWLESPYLDLAGGAPGRLYQPTCLETGYVPGADRDGDGLPDRHDPEPDGDGVPPQQDNCPLTPNPDQADLDGDGHGDACERDADGDRVYVDEDVDDRDPERTERVPSGHSPAPPPDADGDGTDDAHDTCPGLADPDQSDLDLDGLGDACDTDADGDGHHGDDAHPLDATRPEETRSEEGVLTSDGSVDVPGPTAPLLLTALALLAARRVRRTR